MLKFITSRRIVRAYRNEEFFGLIIYGPQGIGKSTYMLKVMYEVLGDWDLVFKNLAFSIDDVIDLVRRTKRERLTVVGLDDVGVHLHKYIALEDRDLTRLITNWVDVIRTKCSSLLLTTVHPGNVLKGLRESLGFNYGRVLRVPEEPLLRAVKVYRQVFVPPNETRLKSTYIDVFKCRLPDDVYERYIKMRREFYERVEETLLKKVEEREEKVKGRV